MDAHSGTRAGDELELLSMLIHAYEEKVLPMDKPDPVAAAVSESSRLKICAAPLNLRPRGI